MAEYIYNPIQALAPGASVIFDGSLPCTRGNVYHRDGSSIFTLKAKTNQQNFARFQVTFNGNIAVPAGGTAAPIAIALAIDGEPILTSRAIVSPTVADRYFNVTSTAIIDVPKCCCTTLTVTNVSAANDGTAPSPINVQNANITINRIA